MGVLVAVVEIMSLNSFSRHLVVIGKAQLGQWQERITSGGVSISGSFVHLFYNGRALSIYVQWGEGQKEVEDLEEEGR